MLPFVHPRLLKSSPLWLGPSYLAPRCSLVCARETAVLFDAVTSYESSAMARAGDVFLVDSATTLTDGFFMVSVQCGAVEARFLKLASSKDLQVNPGLVVLDLDVPSAQCPPCLARHGSFSARSGFVTGTAVGPGCIPWDSSLRPFLYPGFPVCKIHRLKSVLLSSHPQVAPLWTCRSIMNVLGPRAALFWRLPVQERNRTARALLPVLVQATPLPRRDSSDCLWTLTALAPCLAPACFLACQVGCFARWKMVPLPIAGGFRMLTSQSKTLRMQFRKF